MAGAPRPSCSPQAALHSVAALPPGCRPGRQFSGRVNGSTTRRQKGLRACQSPGAQRGRIRV